MKYLKLLLASCALATSLVLLSGVCLQTYAQAEPASATLTKRLIADYGYWSRTQVPPYSAEQIPFHKLTHINHAGVGFDANGSLIVPSGFLERELLNKGHKNGVKVMLLLGGDFSGLEATAGGLNALLKNVKAFITDHGYDGIDIDWEYPSSTEDAAFFRSLLLGLRSVLPSSYIISADGHPGAATATISRTPSSLWTTSM